MKHALLLIVVLLLLCAGTSMAFATELDAILAKHIDALGGHDAIAAITTVAAYTSLDYMGIPGTQVSFVKFPLDYYVKMDLGGTSQEMGCDGITPWLTDFNGLSRPTTAAEHTPIVNEMYFASYSYTGIGGNPGHVEYRGDSLYQGIVYHLLGLFPEGGDSLFLMIDSETGLIDFRIELITGLHSITTYSDYREVAGVMAPFAATMEVPEIPMRVTSRIDSVFVNTDAPDSLFRIPGARGEDFALPAGADSIVIPFILSGHHLYIECSINGVGPFTFLLDSGAGSTMLSRRVADSLHIASAGSFPARGVGGFGEASAGEIDSLNIYQLSLYIKRITIFEPPQGLRQSGQLDGILGYDFFARFPIRIDFERQNVTLFRPKSDRLRMPAAAVDIDIYYQLPILEAHLNGEPIRLIIDLGAASSLLIRSQARAYKALQPFFGDGAEEVVIAGVGGSHTVRMARLDSLTIGTVRISDPMTMASEDFAGLPFPDYIEGIIGVEILKDYTVYIDYISGRAALASPEGAGK